MNELVAALRHCAKRSVCNGCPRCGKHITNCPTELYREAADAIEELGMKLHGDEAAIAGMKREIERMVVAGKPRWIPVTERLPELPCYEYCSKMVIAKASGFGVMPMAYERTKLRGKVTERWRFYWDRVCTEEVTHWMPLPEPPKEET